MSTEHPSPENDLICEKLLGWRRTVVNDSGGWWLDPRGTHRTTPDFATWAEAGLILDAFAALKISFDIDSTDTEDHGTVWGMTRYWGNGNHRTRSEDSGPLTIRAAALEYIKELREEEIAHQENLRG